MGNEASDSNAIEEFAYHASHNLGEPLRKIKSYSDLLERKVQVDQDHETAELFRVIKDAGTRMETILANLLQFVQIDTDRLHHENVNLSQCLDRAVLALSVELERTQTTIESDKLPTVLANDETISLVFTQILKNCIQFHPPKENLKISITGYQDKSTHVIKIKDNGIGMSEDSCKKSMILFAKGHSRGQAPGPGIGLNICQKIIHGLGGEVIINSELNKGTEVTIRLPISAKEASI